MSGLLSASPEASIRPKGTFVHGRRGAVGYDDHGGWEMEWVSDESTEAKLYDQG